MGLKFNLPKEEIIYKYVNEKMPIERIGDCFGVSFKPIRRILKENNVDVIKRDNGYIFKKGHKSYNKKYNIDDKEMIKAKQLYLEGNSINKITKILKYPNNGGISKMLRFEGIKVVHTPNKMSIDRNKIIELYQENVPTNKISEIVGCGITTIYRVLRERNINIINKNKRIDINKSKEKIIDYYNRGNSISKISKIMGCDFCVIKRILEENNIEIKPTKFFIEGKHLNCRINLPEKEVINLYHQENSIKKISKLFNCSEDVIKRILQENCIEIKPQSFYMKGRLSEKKGKTFEQLYGEKSDEIKELVSKRTKEGMNNSEIKEKISKGVSSYYQGIPIEEWKRFISRDPYSQNWDNKFKNLIRKRDNQECMNCGVHREKLKRALNVHHVNYDKELTIPENCICLCDKCHALTNINREYWIKLFQEKLSKLYGYKYDEKGNVIIKLEKKREK